VGGYVYVLFAYIQKGGLRKKKQERRGGGGGGGERNEKGKKAMEMGEQPSIT